MIITMKDGSKEEINCDRYRFSKGFLVLEKKVSPSYKVEWGFEDYWGDSYHYVDEKYTTIKCINTFFIKTLNCD